MWKYLNTVHLFGILHSQPGCLLARIVLLKQGPTSIDQRMILRQQFGVHAVQLLEIHFGVDGSTVWNKLKYTTLCSVMQITWSFPLFLLRSICHVSISFCRLSFLRNLKCLNVILSISVLYVLISHKSPSLLKYSVHQIINVPLETVIPGDSNLSFTCDLRVS